VSIWLEPEPSGWTLIVEDALAEDLGFGDITGQALPPDLLVNWKIEAQADGILCGVGIAEFLLAPYPNDPEECSITVVRNDGDTVSRGQTVIEGLLPVRKALASERTALNFLMHLSGVATLTSQFVHRLSGTKAKIVDTRKTLPGLRALQKYAVRCGGGSNHRMGLFDGAMIKDNHIAALGGVRKAVETVRSQISHMIKIEVECERPEEVREAIEAGAEVILLDNMDPFMMREVVKTYAGKALFEASGGINLDTVKGVAQTGVDIISVGALTHSAPSLAFHLEFE
jgi:nicotinate-nucleotide pyrophosphorylase (carboxylating)